MDNFAIGYNWKIGSGLLIQELRLNFSAQNLFTLSGYTGQDPEVRYANTPFYRDQTPSTTSPAPFTVGLDRRATYPQARTFAFGVALKI
jgi:iron complex outermembrane receptor protein